MEAYGFEIGIKENHHVCTELVSEYKHKLVAMAGTTAKKGEVLVDEPGQFDQKVAHRLRVLLGGR